MTNGEATLTPARIIGVCITLTMAINGISLAIIRSYDSDLDKLAVKVEQKADFEIINELAVKVEQKADTVEVERKTDQRYRASDAERDLRLVNFRFSRNEQNIQRCLDFIETHRRGKEHE